FEQNPGLSIVLGASNSYSGGTEINAGTWTGLTNTSFGTGTIWFASSGQMALGPGLTELTNPITSRLGGMKITAAGPVTLSGPILLGGTGSIVCNSTATLTISGSISGYGTGIQNGG